MTKNGKIKVELTEPQVEALLRATALMKDAVTRRAYATLRASLDKHNAEQVPASGQ